MLLHTLRIVAFLLCGLCPYAFAGEAEAPAAPAASAPAEPERIDISGRTQQSLERLKTIASEISGLALSDEVGAWVAAANERLDEQFGEIDGMPARMMAWSAPELDDVMRQVKEQGDDAKGRAEALDEVALALEQRRGDLKTIAATWREVNATTDEIPEALTTRIADILTRCGEISEVAQTNLNAVAQLQNEIIDLRGRLDAISDALTQHHDERRGALFKFQHPPVWLMDSSTMAETYSHNTRGVVDRWRKDGKAFLDGSSTNLMLHAATLVLVLLGIRALRAGAIRGGVDPTETRLLARPVASGVLLVLLAEGLFYPTVPPSIEILFGVVAAFTAIVVVRPFLGPELRRAMVTLVGLYVVDRLLSMVAGGSPPYRVLMIASGIALTVLILVASQKHYVDVLHERGLRRSVIRPIFTMGLILIAVAVVLNVLGNVDLAVLLTGGVIRSLLLLVVVFTIYLILNDLISLLVRPGVVTRFRTIVRHRDSIARGARKPILWLAGLVWFTATASFFDLLAPSTDWVKSVLAAEAKLGDVTLSLGRVVAFVVAIWVAIVASRLTRAVLAEDVLPRFRLPRGVPNTIGTTVNYVIVLIGIMIGAGFLGINLSSLGLILGALGVGIGFGLQNIVNNFVSGLILVFERPIQVGDVVEVGTLFGRVTQIGLRASRVRTFGGAEIIVPNGDLVSQQVTNWTLSDKRRRLELEIGVAYRSDPEQVQSILMQIVLDDEDVLDDPEPMVVFEAFGDSALQFRVFAWIADFDEGLSMRTQLHTKINKGLKEAGVEIPFPQRDLHVRSIQTDDALHLSGPEPT